MQIQEQENILLQHLQEEAKNTSASMKYKYQPCSKQSKSVYREALEIQQNSSQVIQQAISIQIRLAIPQSKPYFVQLISKQELEERYIPNYRSTFRHLESWDNSTITQRISDDMNKLIKCGHKKLVGYTHGQMCSILPLIMWTDSPRGVNHELKNPGSTALQKRLFRIIFIHHLKDEDNIYQLLKINKNKNKKKGNMKLANKESMIKMIKGHFNKILTEHINLVELVDGRYVDSSLQLDSLEVQPVNRRDFFNLIFLISQKMRRNQFLMSQYEENLISMQARNLNLYRYLSQKTLEENQFITQLKEKIKLTGKIRQSNLQNQQNQSRNQESQAQDRMESEPNEIQIKQGDSVGQFLNLDDQKSERSQESFLENMNWHSQN